MLSGEKAPLGASPQQANTRQEKIIKTYYWIIIDVTHPSLLVCYPYETAPCKIYRLKIKDMSYLKKKTSKLSA